MEKVRELEKGSRWYLWFPALAAIIWGVSCHLPPENLFLGGLGLEGFGQASPLVVYNKDNIFDYIDGEAEVYLKEGFLLLYTQSYQKQETNALITVDAYDLGTPDGAQDIFTRYSEEGGSEIQGLGESSWTDNYIILFRRGRYFFRVWPDPSPESEVKPGLKDLVELSRAIDSALAKPVRMTDTNVR